MHQRLVLTQHMSWWRDGAQVQGFTGVPRPSHLRLPGGKNVGRRSLSSKPLSQHVRELQQSPTNFCLLGYFSSLR